MKRFYLLSILLTVIIASAKSQTTNDVLNLLVSNGAITQVQADSVRADAAIKQQDADSKRKSFGINSSKLLQVGGYGQFLYQVLQEEGKPDGFVIRRAYLDIKGNITPYWSYRMQTDFAASPKLVDLYTEFKVKEYLNITVGQMLLPFSYSNVTSSTALEIADRPQVVEALVARSKDIIGSQNGHDVGIQVGGSLIKINDQKLIEYKIGVFNGAGSNTLTDNNEVKDVVGRIVFHPIKGLGVGGSFYNGWADSTFQKKDTVATGKRIRYGAEVSYNYKIVSFSSEFIYGNDGPFNRAGLYAQAGVFVWPSKIQVVARYDIYDKNLDKTDDRSTYYTIGSNFVFNPNVKLQLSYSYCAEENSFKNNNRAAAQLQISF